MAVTVPETSKRFKWDDNNNEKIESRRRMRSNLCRVGAVLGALSFVVALWKNSRNQSRLELSMRMRGHENFAKATSNEVQTTASRHASTPLKLSSDIVKALGKADSEIATVQPLLEDHEHVQASPRVNKIAKLEISHAMPKTPLHTAAPPPESAADIAKAKREAELWSTEQAMKRALDAETAHKSGSLWQHTVDIVHRNDPNTNLISKLRPHLFSDKQSENAEAKEGALKRVQSRGGSMQSKLKAELDAKTKNVMGRMEDKTVDMQKRALNADAHQSKAAETAAAHKSMPLTDMKKMLKSQLDNSVESVVKRAKQLQGFSTDTQLEKRLKAELDAKTKAQEKELLVSQRMKQSLAAARHKLHGRVSRAARVRSQLSKEMKEENAIRHQLDLQAEQAGKRMLKQQLSPKQSAQQSKPHEATRADLEEELRRRLDTKDKRMLQSGSQQQQDHKGNNVVKGKEDPMEKELQEKLAGGTKPGTKGSVHDLQDYLRKQLDATDQVKQSTLYRHTVQGHLLKRLRSSSSAAAGNTPSNIAARNRALHNAAMRLFRNSMRRAETNGGSDSAKSGGSSSGTASASVHSAAANGHAANAGTGSLLRDALQSARAGQRHEPFGALHRQEEQEGRVKAARQAQITDVPTAIEKVMEGTLERARGVEPFAELHKAGEGAAADAGEVHDMAHASQHSTIQAAGLSKADGLVLGHMRELRAADATADEIRRARDRTVHQAQQEEQEAVE